MKVFISYSHRDAIWLERVLVHLKPLSRRYEIEIWDDTKIKAGSKWKTEITNALREATVAILLVSADFLSSDFIVNQELPPLLSAAENHGTLILPVILSPSYFARTEILSQFQAINDPSKPLVNLTKGEQEEILVKVTERIEAFVLSSPSSSQEANPELTDAVKTQDRLDRLLALYPNIVKKQRES